VANWWWSGYARLYDWLWAGPISDALGEAIRARTAPSYGTVLDAGAGTGLIAPVLAGLGPLVGIDSNRAMLAQARRRPGTWILADAAHPPFRPDTMTTIVSANVLHLCRTPDAVLAALADLLRPAGRLILCWPPDEVGSWHVARAERTRGTGLATVAARLAVRLIFAVLAVGPGSVRRAPTPRLLAMVRAVADGRGLRHTHEIVLDGLQHLVVLSRPARPAMETS